MQSRIVIRDTVQASNIYGLNHLLLIWLDPYICYSKGTKTLEGYDKLFYYSLWSVKKLGSE